MTTKTRYADLAIAGAPPAFDEPLHVGRPNIGDRAALLARIEGALDRRWLTNNGPLVQEFEARLAGYLGVRHCIAMCNATVALEIAIRAVGFRGEVIVPSFTFVATAHALQWQQVTPVFCDVDPATHNIDPDRVEALITPRTTGLIGVHVWGRPCPVDRLEAIAARHGLGVIYDAAHAFGCTRGGVPVGGSGRAEIFSFHATKFFNTFEGGALTTNEDDLARRVRLMTNFGFAGYDEVVSLGINGKMSEIAAAMGLTSLDHVDEFIAINRRNHGAYRRRLAAIPGVTSVDYDEQQRSNYQYVVIEVDEDAAGLSRDALKDVLWAENVRARRYFFPACHRMEPYRSAFPHSGRLLPETERLSDRVLSLPTGTAVGPGEIATICDIIGTAVAHADRVTARLHETCPH